MTLLSEIETLRLSQIMLNASRACNETIMCSGHGKCFYEQFKVDEVGKYLCKCINQYVGEHCEWRDFENQKLVETSFLTMKKLSAENITLENYFKIISIMRNYASIIEGVNRDFIQLAIAKA